jgi:endonuclease/exonuclease/phosphatase family metal-dependent hydrolase
MTDFKVMTWNVENLFGPGEDAGPDTQEQYQRKLISLAAVILNIEPDVLALQEVGSVPALNELAGMLQGKYPHKQVSAHPDPRGIRVAFLSRLPIEATEEITQFAAEGLPNVPSVDKDGKLATATALGRAALGVTVTPRHNFPIHLITAHLKSKLLTYPAVNGGPRYIPKDENERARMGGLALLKRTAEAVTLRAKANAILEAKAEAALMLMGDLNDAPNAATTQLLQGPNGSEIGTRSFNQADKGDRTRLFNLAALLPIDHRYTRIENGTPELIDHILVSQKLLPGQPRRLPVVDIHIGGGGLPSISNDPTERQGQPGSDHAPLFATFKLD